MLESSHYNAVMVVIMLKSASDKTSLEGSVDLHVMICYILTLYCLRYRVVLHLWKCSHEVSESLNSALMSIGSFSFKEDWIRWKGGHDANFA